jgi:integrase
MFPSPEGDFSYSKLRDPRVTTRTLKRRARKLGFNNLRPFHDLRGTHETLLLDAGVPLRAVADRCGHDPVVLLRNYAKGTRKADTMANAVIAEITKGILENG